MNDRQNMILCIFDPKSPRISAFEVHEWIYETLQLPEEDVRMIQIDGPRRRVYIKLNTSGQTHAVIQKTSCQMAYRHDNGETSTVLREIAEKGARKVRISDLPPEVTDQAISRALLIYGEVLKTRKKFGPMHIDIKSPIAFALL